MANRGGKSGNRPGGNLAIDPQGNLATTGGKSGNRIYHQRDYHQPVLITNKNDHSRQRRQKPSPTHELSKSDKARKQTRKRRKFPDLNPWNLANPNDLYSVHSILAYYGMVSDSFDGVHRVVLAGVMACRLSTRNTRGYFVRIIEDGFTEFGPADRDRDLAKQMLRELYA